MPIAFLPARLVRLPVVAFALAALAFVLSVKPVSAQVGAGAGGVGGVGGGGVGGGGVGGGGVGGGGVGGGGLGGIGGGGNAAGAAGVRVDAQGVLRTTLVPDAGLSLERRREAVAKLPNDLRRKSPLREVALSRLETRVAEAAAAGRGIPDDLEKLAGLTRVQYVFVYPGVDGKAGEVVIAGPAEPWMADAMGRTIGAESGAPTVLLEDLTAALRCFAPGNPQDRLVGCSIDPRQEGLAALQAFLKKVGRVNPNAGADELVTGMKNALGTQIVSVQGLSPATHFAQVMVEADYRMKLIGIGLEPPPVKMTTWIDLASGGAVAANALQRWYFVPDYQCVRISEDDLAIELVGQGVKLCGADEVVQADGTRLGANRADKASRTFTETFTRKYAEISGRSAVYAQLRTLVDLLVAAAYMQEHDAYGKAGWGAEQLRDEAIYAIERLTPPAEVETAINAVWRQNRLLTPIGGGVTVHPRRALDPTNLLVDEKGTVDAARTGAQVIPADRWWWD